MGKIRIPCRRCGKTTRTPTSPHSEFCSKKCFDKYFEENAYAEDSKLEERVEAATKEVKVQAGPESDDKIERLRWRCENDLWFLCKEVLEWDLLGAFHERACDEINEIVVVNKKCLFLWPREHLKTTILTISKAIQLILKTKGTIRILIANATADNAHLMLGQIKEIILHNEFLDMLYPWLRPKNIRQSVWREDAIKLDTAETTKKKENTIDAIGVGGNIVSRHYDVAILDDLVNPDNARTSHGREEVITWYKYLLSIVGRKASVWAIGTRYHYYDLYDFLKKTGNYYVSEHKAIDNGVVLFPEEFSEEALKEIREEQGPYIYSCQYQNEPVDEADQQFPEKHARTFTDLPDRVQHYTLIDLINPETVKARKDNAVVLDVAVDPDGRWYVNDYRFGRLSPSEIITASVEFFWKYKTFRIGLNAVGYERTLRHNFEEHQRKTNVPIANIVEVARIGNTSKYQRIIAMQPKWIRGEILYRDWMKEFMDEMVMFPSCETDDFADALATLPYVLVSLVSTAGYEDYYYDEYEPLDEEVAY